MLDRFGPLADEEKRAEQRHLSYLDLEIDVLLALLRNLDGRTMLRCEGLPEAKVVGLRLLEAKPFTVRVFLEGEAFRACEPGLFVPGTTEPSWRRVYGLEMRFSTLAEAGEEIEVHHGLFFECEEGRSHV